MSESDDSGLGSSEDDSEDCGTKQTIVIDKGSGTMRVGFARKERPDYVLPSLLASDWFVHPAGHARSASTEFCSRLYSFKSIRMPIFVGKAARDHHISKGMNAMRPLEHGIITSWEGMDAMLHKAFKTVGVKCDESRVMITMSPRGPKVHREHMAEIMFEKYEAAAVSMQMQSVLALLATGRTTGCVHTSGSGNTMAVPIYEGVALTFAMRQMALAGDDLTRWLAKMLIAKGYTFNSNASLDQVNKIKEKLTYVCDDYENEMKAASDCSDRSESFKLPDGTMIEVNTVRFKCPEALFQPSLYSDETQMLGIQDTMFTAITAVDRDLHETLFKNIVLSGGSTMFRDISKRFTHELVSRRKGRSGGQLPLSKMSTGTRNRSTALADDDECVQIKVSRDLNAVWHGGTILSSLGTFQEKWVTQDEFDDAGMSIVHRKCM